MKFVLFAVAALLVAWLLAVAIKVGAGREGVLDKIIYGGGTLLAGLLVITILVVLSTLGLHGVMTE